MELAALHQVTHVSKELWVVEADRGVNVAVGASEGICVEALASPGVLLGKVIGDVFVVVWVPGDDAGLPRLVGERRTPDLGVYR